MIDNQAAAGAPAVSWMEMLGAAGTCIDISQTMVGFMAVGSETIDMISVVVYVKAGTE